jgi:hypothetical protein
MAGSKNPVPPSILSVNNINNEAARTGSARSNKNAVTKTDQANKGILCIVIPGARMFNIVVIKLIAPNIEEKPAANRPIIMKSNAGPGAPLVESGGYMTQPPPKPFPEAEPGTKKLISKQIKATGRSQNDRLFILGNAISGAPIIIGTNQLPNPPMTAGITMKKIIIKPCIDAKTL